jgi:hypothetical protein
MDAIYEYKFVRLGEYRGSAWFGVSGKARGVYEDAVHEHARDGWRLVQIFAPGVAAFGAAKYYELIFERERPDPPSAPAGGRSVVQHGHEVAADRSSILAIRADTARPPTVKACAAGRMPMRDGPRQPTRNQRR